MKKIFSITTLILLTSCATTPVNSPEFKAEYMPDLTLNKNKAACWKATLSGLNERGYKIKKSDEASGSIETDRRKFNVTATATTSGNQYSSGSVSIAQLEQSDKLWIKVTAQGSKCTVQYVKARLWNGEEELESVQSAGGKWYLKNVINPLNREISEAG